MANLSDYMAAIDECRARGIKVTEIRMPFSLIVGRLMPRPLPGERLTFCGIPCELTDE